MNKEISDLIVARLEAQYPEAECSLRYDGDPWKLLIMSILSAQCTDQRVNTASVALFRRFPNARSMAESDVTEIEPYIRSCGLYHTKAQSIKNTCIALCERYAGIVPSDMDELLTLPGVGRKIANLIRGDIFGLPGIVCDTHCIRLSGRLGYIRENERNPVKLEKLLSAIIDPEKQSAFCHRLVLFGRDCCTARYPKCDCCPISQYCSHDIAEKKQQAISFKREREEKRNEFIERYNNILEEFSLSELETLPEEKKQKLLLVVKHIEKQTRQFLKKSRILSQSVPDKTK